MKLLAFDNVSGRCVYGPDWRPEVTPYLLSAVGERFSEATPRVLDDEAVPNVAQEHLVWVDGVVVVDAPADPILIYAHINITGGDGDTPPGVELGSSGLLTITAEVRATADPASPLIAPLSGEWRITIRNQAGGPPDIVQVLVEGGQVVKRADHTPGVVYDPPEVIGVYAIDEADFIPLVLGGQTYVLKLVDPAKAQFKVYRKL